MSDSEHSTVTYTSISIPVEDDSDIGSPRVDGPPIMPEHPYAYIMAAYGVPPSPDYIPGLEVTPSPDYIPGPEGPPSPDYVPGPEEPEQAPPSPIYLPYERISKKKMKNEAKTTKPDSEWKSRKRQSQSPSPSLKKST
ncbi:hypothetical protein Tco_0664742 [Tanacetum coccineum]